MLPDMSEHECRAADLSVKGALLLTPLKVPPGVAIVTYVDEIGRIEAETGERTSNGLRIAFRVTGVRLERLAARLNSTLSGADDRRHERIVPDNRNAQVTLADGKLYPCEIIDISVSGAAIRIGARPGLGSQLLLGKTRGRVVRHLADGIAIEFMTRLDTRLLRRTGA
jgi:hypothetical protein